MDDESGKKMNKKKGIKIMRIIALVMSCFALLMLLYTSYYHYKTGRFSLERVIKKYAKETEEFCGSRVINEIGEMPSDSMIYLSTAPADSIPMVYYGREWSPEIPAQLWHAAIPTGTEDTLWVDDMQ